MGHLILFSIWLFKKILKTFTEAMFAFIVVFWVLSWLTMTPFILPDIWEKNQWPFWLLVLIELVYWVPALVIFFGYTAKLYIEYQKEWRRRNGR